jgi:hypothetical protein
MKLEKNQHMPHGVVKNRWLLSERVEVQPFQPTHATRSGEKQVATFRKG